MGTLKGTGSLMFIIIIASLMWWVISVRVTDTLETISNCENMVDIF